MIAGGIPKPCDKHASSIAEMAFAMLNAMKTLKDPSDETDTGAHLKLRVGKLSKASLMPLSVVILRLHLFIVRCCRYS